MIFGKYINRYYLKNGPILLLGVAALVLVDYFQLLIPEFYRIVVNGVNVGRVEIDGILVDFTLDVLLDEVCLPMIFTILAMVVGRFLWRVCFFGAAVRVETDLRCQMFARSKDLSQEYYQKNKVGSLMSLYTNDLDTIQECFGDGMLMFFDALVLGSMALVKMLRMDLFLTALSMIPLVLLGVMGLTLGRMMVKRWEVRQEAFSDLSDFAQENFSGIAVVKAFVKEYVQLQAFARLNRENEDANVSYTRVSTLLTILVTLFVESVICVILGYGGYLVYQSRFDAGMLIEYIGYFSSIVWPIMAIAMLIEKTSRGKASVNRVSELLDTEIDVKDREGVSEPDAVKGKIEFRHLSFRYPGSDSDVLKDVSFTIEPGESVGIVGRTGAGKTTLVDLILRTWNVADGTLFVDDKDVNDISIRSVRAACAYVPQDNFLFSDTIARNIAFSEEEEGDLSRTLSERKEDRLSRVLSEQKEDRPSVGRSARKENGPSVGRPARKENAPSGAWSAWKEEDLSRNRSARKENDRSGSQSARKADDLAVRIRKAAINADVDADISAFTEGYETILGERGVTVSGGQKQRISIARALMKDAPILILDDSVSAVDTGTERVILDHLKERVGKTTILIAHRISTVEQMDKIVFLEEGQVKAVGSHVELCKTCGAYQRMVQLQQLEDEERRRGGADHA
ncbi:MAG: ABC transporter ATP-binding protein/permease [Lachnospiraceae bacterium]|nr:ABC transporter ATP-binding protein/permease [Lachnospiraceae bacterium]